MVRTKSQCGYRTGTQAVKAAHVRLELSPRPESDLGTTSLLEGLANIEFEPKSALQSTPSSILELIKTSVWTMYCRRTGHMVVRPDDCRERKLLEDLPNMEGKHRIGMRRSL